MTERNRDALKQLFETGDSLIQTSFEDLIDSAVNTTDTTAQSLASNFTVPNMNVTGTLTAQNVTASSFTGVELTATSANVTNINATTISAAGTISGDALARSVNTSVNAAGTTQGAATQISNGINRVALVSAGANDGIRLRQVTGETQTIFNDTNINLNVYPVTGAEINALGVNAAYVVSASVRIGFVSLNNSLYITDR